MNIWRVTSRTGKTIHLTSDRVKTMCGRTIGDDWKFIFLLSGRNEAMEHVENLCSRCNDFNIEEWEKELVHGTEDNSTNKDNVQSVRGRKI